MLSAARIALKTRKSTTNGEQGMVASIVGTLEGFYFVTWCAWKRAKKCDPNPVLLTLSFVLVFIAGFILEGTLVLCQSILVEAKDSCLHLYAGAVKVATSRKHFAWECAAAILALQLCCEEEILAFWLAIEVTLNQSAVQAQLHLVATSVTLPRLVSASSSSETSSVVSTPDDSCDAYASDTESGYGGSDTSPEDLRRMVVERSPLPSSSSFGSLMSLATSEFGDDFSDVSSVGADWGSDEE